MNEMPNVPRAFIRQDNHVDLREWARRQFMDAGIDPGNIEIHRECPACNPEKYWTYRGGDREAVKAGHTNMLTCAMHE